MADSFGQPFGVETDQGTQIKFTPTRGPTLPATASPTDMPVVSGITNGSFRQYLRGGIYDCVTDFQRRHFLIIVQNDTNQ